MGRWFWCLWRSGNWIIFGTSQSLPSLLSDRNGRSAAPLAGAAYRADAARTRSDDPEASALRATDAQIDRGRFKLLSAADIASGIVLRVAIAPAW